MTRIKMDRIDLIIKKFSSVLNKCGFKRISGMVLDLILIKHRVPMSRVVVRMNDTHISY